MAKTLGHAGSLSSAVPMVRSLRSVWMLRLTLGSIVTLATVVILVGTSWDIQWHSFVGRDRTLIPPHIMILSGIALGGLAALAAVLIETLWTRRNPLLAKHTTGFADLFHSSLGSYIVGFAALNGGIAFPLDAYWHSLYGIDVSIWAPFHVMALVGAAIIALGAFYMLISAAQLATSSGDRRTARMANIGAIIAFGTMMGFFTILLLDAVSSRGTLRLGGLAINLFPLLSGLVIAWLFISIKFVMPRRWSASSVLLVYILLGLLFIAFVPPATNALVASEHLSYRKGLGIFTNLSAVTLQGWYLAPIIVAPLVDFFFSRSLLKGWSSRKTFIMLAVITLIACIPVQVIRPNLFLTLAVRLGAAGILASLLLGVLGTVMGTWLGRRMGTSMQQVERAA